MIILKEKKWIMKDYDIPDYHYYKAWWVYYYNAVCYKQIIALCVNNASQHGSVVNTSF